MHDTHRLHPSRSRDVSDAEGVIRELYAITSDYRAGFSGQLRRILQLGVGRYDLDVGIVARIENDDYTVVQAVSPGSSLAPGTVFSLQRTYCALTTAAGGPVGFTHAGASELRAHPCYHDFQREAYIGTPILVEGRVFGTLNFSSAGAREREFRDVDVDALQLMATWIGSGLSRRKLWDQVHALEALIPICAGCKQVPTELGDWTELEAYFSERTASSFSHGLCPPCLATYSG